MADGNRQSPWAGMVIEGAIGTYKLIKELGSGGNGTVFTIEIISQNAQLPSNKEFVIKILTVRDMKAKEQKKRQQRFQNEINGVCKIQNDVGGIIPIYDAFSFLETRGDFDWYLMPKAMKYNFKWISSTERKLKDMRDVGESILQLHKKRLGHRDIKPHNLLLYNNRVCLSDFGLIWNMDGIEDHITDIYDNMGPASIRPPEMRSIEELKGVDYRKSDVYLFAKTMWIILTGKSEGFSDEYKRSDKAVYLKKQELGLETVEPLHEMMELATRYYWKERIDIDDCLQYIDEQLNIITKRSSQSDINRWKYLEMAKEISETIPADIKIYQDMPSILSVLKKMEGIGYLAFEEAGKVYEPIFLKSIQYLPEYLFELNVADNHRKSGKKIIVEIVRVFVEKDLTCTINIKEISNPPKDIPIFINLNAALKSFDKHIGISGKYEIRLVQTGIYF